MEIKFDKKFDSEFSKFDKNVFDKKKIKIEVDKSIKSNGEIQTASVIPYIFPLLFLLLGFAILLYSLISLQIFSYDKYKQRSQLNQFELSEIKPNRGLILDRNGKQLAQNIPAISVYISIDEYRNPDLTLDLEKLSLTTQKLETLLGDEWKKGSGKGYSTIYDKVVSIWDGYTAAEKSWIRNFEILSALSNDAAVKIKGNSIDLPNIFTQTGSKRTYPFGEAFSHILGYTGDVYQEDLAKLSYVGFNDVIGRSGLEQMYDKDLFGTKGSIAKERGVEGQTEITQAISGATLNLSIDYLMQKNLYAQLKSGITRYGAKGGAAIIEDVTTGEIVAMASYPSFNNNLFIGGISQKDYNKILRSGSNPLLNRAIGAQVPPGSTFKTIVASAALDAKAITKNTVYVSRSGYTFSDGRPFPEYGNNAYGSLNLIDAISKSSNIYFCEVIRNWDMNRLVPYLEDFGIGRITNIDLYGEEAGRLPSPKNKIQLAKTTSPWLDPVWYPEGDSCNSVIGQGITTVTPIQMVNWVSAIANGGVLHTPHLATSLDFQDGSRKVLDWKPLENRVASSDALEIVREGMWATVNGPKRVVIPLYNSKPTVGAKTGTAEFGRVDSEGRYEHTHAWVAGFYPFSKPKYAFVVFLEDGGASNNAAQVARYFIDWWYAKGK